jgi:hypothetical protein
MSTHLVRRVDRHRTPDKGYPYDAEHRPEPYEQVQRDVGSSLFLGAIVLVAMMALIVFGLV